MQQAISTILFPESYFFGGATQGLQGDPMRQILMGATVGLAVPAARPIRILEIGSWIGFSALTWAQAIERFVPHKGTLLCVDPWTSYFTDEDVRQADVYRHMDYMGRTGLAYDLFCHNIRFAPKGVQIDHIRGLSHNILPHLRKEGFDIIYIDGSHYYDDVLKDLRLADELLTEGGIMCGDDLELQLAECDRELTERNGSADCIADPATGRDYHPGVTLAVGEYFGSVSALRGYWHMRKTATGYEAVSFEGASMFVPEHFPDTYKRPFEAILNRWPSFWK
ncbi:class I SAM-dependent methyltransferase [Azospirillum sp.]|uniref:class I SAM-dependent methyltransferase n=1 Tax=Azospirillum sp. TaxID=34012 RepID=UPI003D709B58